MLKELLTIASLLIISLSCVFALVYYVNNGYTFKKKQIRWYKFDSPKNYKTDLDQNKTFKQDDIWLDIRNELESKTTN